MSICVYEKVIPERCCILKCTSDCNIESAINANYQFILGTLLFYFRVHKGSPKFLARSPFMGEGMVGQVAGKWLVIEMHPLEIF